MKQKKDNINLKSKAKGGIRGIRNGIVSDKIPPHPIQVEINVTKIPPHPNQAGIKATEIPPHPRINTTEIPPHPGIKPREIPSHPETIILETKKKTSKRKKAKRLLNSKR